MNVTYQLSSILDVFFFSKYCVKKRNHYFTPQKLITYTLTFTQFLNTVYNIISRNFFQIEEKWTTTIEKWQGVITCTFSVLSSILLSKHLIPPLFDTNVHKWLDKHWLTENFYKTMKWSSALKRTFLHVTNKAHSFHLIPYQHNARKETHTIPTYMYPCDVKKTYVHNYYLCMRVFYFACNFSKNAGKYFF